MLPRLWRSTSAVTAVSSTSDTAGGNNEAGLGVTLSATFPPDPFWARSVVTPCGCGDASKDGSSRSREQGKDRMPSRRGTSFTECGASLQRNLSSHRGFERRTSHGPGRVPPGVHREPACARVRTRDIGSSGADSRTHQLRRGATPCQPRHVTVHVNASCSAPAAGRETWNPTCVRRTCGACATCRHRYRTARSSA